MLVPGARIFLVLGSPKLGDTEEDPRTRKIRTNQTKMAASRSVHG